MLFATATIDIDGERIVLQKTHQMVVSKVRQISTKEMFYDRISLSEVNPIIEEYIGLH
ncbi:hypothetical protein [Lysinibacillus sphaericus]|uniref:hypothetical protein n=1 Tax=Lysinibacillus sphaericus TaxID=1421 RepID=UPI001A7EC0EF|nr:hypothetical protein [Lysinibacillus sphaericus]